MKLIFFMMIIGLLNDCVLSMHPQSLFEKAFEEHRAALSRNVVPPNDNIPAGTDNESQELLRIIREQLSPSQETLLKRIAMLFGKHHVVKNSNETHEDISLETIHDLQVLRGDSDNPTSCIICVIPTQTAGGRMRLAKRLMRLYPMDHIHKFQEVLNQIRAIAPYQLDFLCGLMGRLSTIETALLSLWIAEEPGKKDPLQDYVSQRTPSSSFGEPSADVIGLCNATSDKMDQEWFYHRFLAWFYNFFTRAKCKSDAFITVVENLLKNKIDSLFVFFDVIQEMNTGLHKLNVVPEVSSKLGAFLNLKEVQELKRLRNELNMANNAITRLGLFFKISTHLYAIRSNLLSIYYVLGKLDIFLALSRLIRRSDYSLATFFKGQQTSLDLSNYWHMLIRDKITYNSISLSPTEQHIVVITGCNGGGKTIAIKAIGLCHYLSKTLGIVPAEKCLISENFSLLTSIRIKDVAAQQGQGGRSLFQSQVERLTTIVNQAVNSSGKTVLIIDEPLTATYESVSVQLLITYLALLRGRSGHILCFLTSHLPSLIQELHKDPKNYRLLYGHKDFLVNSDPKGSDTVEAALDMVAQYMSAGLVANVRERMLLNAGQRISP